MKRPSISLIHKALLAVTLVLLPILITFLYTYSQNKKMLQEHALKNLAVIAELSEAQVYQFMEMEKRRAQDFSSDGFIRERLQRILKGDKPAVSGLNAHLVKNKIPLDKNIEQILIISMQGRVAASTNASIIGKDVSKEIFFTRGKDDWNIIEKNIVAANPPALAIASPITDKDTGELIGSLVNLVSISAFNHALDGSLAKESGAISSGIKNHLKTLEVYLVNKNGIMLTDSLLIKDEILKQRADTLPVQKCINENKEFAGFYKDYRGIEVAGASMCIPKLKWTLLAEVNSYEILTPVRNMRRSAIITISTVVVLISTLFMFFFRGVILPLRRASRSAEAIANGEYDINLPVETKDEIGMLSASFNVMSHHIKNRTKLLKQSEERLGAIIDNSTAIIYMKDIQGRYIMANRRWETLFGLNKEQIAGKTDHDIFPKDTANMLRLNDMKILQNSAPLQFDETVPQSDGMHHYISVKFPLFNQNGVTYAVCGISTDITERKKSEEAQFEAQQRYAELINSLPVGIYKRKATGELIEVNPAALSVLDLDSKEDFANHSVEEFYKDKNKFKEVSDKLAKQGFVKDEETEFISAKGRRFWCSFSGATRKDKNGSSYFSGIFFDITEKKRAEDARIETQQKYEELINDLPVGIYRRMITGQLVEANPMAVAMFEAGSKEELANYNVTAFYQDKNKLKEVNDKLLKYGSVKNEELKALTVKGRPFWCSFSAVAKKDKGGNAYIDGIVEDITEKRMLEDQLRHSQKMEAIGQLAGGIAHDFNNILTAIIGYGNLLLRKKQGDDMVKDYVGEMLGAANRAANLTKDLLSFSRKHIIATQPFELNELVKKTEKILARVIGEHIEIKATITDKNLVVKIDPALIEQTLFNLATNAKDAMPDGGRLLIGTDIITLDNNFIYAHGYGKAGRYAVLTFADTGIGMNREVQSRLFEPFFTTKEVGKGTGLGLSTVYGIVKQHGGYINVYSEPGHGTTFKIYLPMAEGTMPVEEKALPDIIASMGNMETILIAEDDPNTREITRAVLEEYNYNIIEAENGDDAVNKFTANKDEIRLVILDMIMPKKGGLEAYKEIRKINPSAKVIFLSGYPGDMIKMEDITREGLILVSKPVSPNELSIKIKEILGK